MVNYVKLLCVTFYSHLNFDKHISNVCSSPYFHNRALRHIRPFLDLETLCFFRSRLNYLNSIHTGIFSRNIHRLQLVQNSLARVVTHSTTNTTSALNSLHWLPIQQRINFKLANLVHHSLNPSKLIIFNTSLHSISRQLRSASISSSPNVVLNIALASRGFRHAGSSLWNSLPYHLRSIESYTVFKSNKKTHLFSSASISGP